MTKDLERGLRPRLCIAQPKPDQGDLARIRLRPGQAKNMTCERSANSQLSNPWRVDVQKTQPVKGEES